MLTLQEIAKLREAGLGVKTGTERESLSKRTDATPVAEPILSDNRDISIGDTKIVGGMVGGIAKDLYKRAENLVMDAQKAGQKSSELPPVEKALSAISYGAKKGIETIAGGVGDIFSNMISPFIPQKVKDVYGEETATAIADIKKATDENPMIKNLITTLATKAKDNPEVAGILSDALSDVLNITSIGTGGAIEQPIKKSIVSGVENLIEGVNATRSATGELVSNIASKGQEIIPKTKEILTSAKNKVTGVTPLVGEDKVFGDALKIAREKVTPAYEELAAQEGRTFVEGRTKKVNFRPTRREELLADSIKPLLEQGRIKPDALPFENIPEISLEVSRINQGVKQMIEKNKIPFNSKQLRLKLEAVKADSSIVFASDPTLERTYNTLIDAFIKETSKMDTAGLFEARQSFDKIPAVKKLLDGMKGAQGENLRRQAVLDIRRAANEYVADLLNVNKQSVILKNLQPKEASSLIERAKVFKKAEDFARAEKATLQKKITDETYRAERRRIEKSMKKGDTLDEAIAKEGIPIDIEADLLDIWNLAHTTISPTAGKAMSEALRKETYMLEVISNLAEKSKGLAGSTNVSRFMDNNPIIKKLTSQAIPFGIGAGAF